jgi:hypothetical protein
VTWAIGTDQQVQDREPVRDFLTWMHTQAFDAHPKVKTLVVDDGQAALEADFVGTHTGEFLGMPATGKSVQVPYCVVYDCEATRSLPCAPTSPWNCSPNSSSELWRFGPLSGNRVFAFGPQDSHYWAQLREGPAWRM